MRKKREIKPEHEKYYKTLEEIRQAGICNMWGADEYLVRFHRGLRKEEAIDILLTWIENYEGLNKKYGWQK